MVEPVPGERSAACASKDKPACLVITVPSGVVSHNDAEVFRAVIVEGLVEDDSGPFSQREWQVAAEDLVALRWNQVIRDTAEAGLAGLDHIEVKCS